MPIPSTTYVLATHLSLVVGMTPCPLPSHLQSHFNYKRVHEVRFNRKMVQEVDKGLFAIYPPAGCSFRAGLAVRSIGFSFSHSRSGGQDIEDGAMSRANTMFDFFAMEKTRSCARGAKLSAISRIDPQLLRRVIASTLPPPSSQLFPSPPPPLPILDPSCRSVATAESDSSSAPLTIFYDGTVSVFDLAQDKAEAVMKLAERTMDYRLLAQLNEGKWPTACTSPSKISVGGLKSKPSFVRRAAAHSPEEIAATLPRETPTEVDREGAIHGGPRGGFGEDDGFGRVDPSNF